MSPLVSQNGKERFRALARPLSSALVRANVHPNVLTFLGLALAGVSAVLLAAGRFRWGALFFLAGGLFDMLDGAVARAAGKGSPFGAFLDSTVDRYAEILPYLGLAFAFRDDRLFYLPFLAITGSLMVSYARARVEGLGGSCRVGLLERPERIVLLFLGLILGPLALKVSLVLLAVGSHVTALQRMLHARSVL
jgi:CDP-diacylglycerol--glycerol-3-phosphate 3-phosphatidyltransferase